MKLPGFLTIPSHAQFPHELRVEEGQQGIPGWGWVAMGRKRGFLA